MTIVLHGDNNVASRIALNEHIAQIKKTGDEEIIRLDGEKLDLTELKQALESQSLFGSERLVVIENLLSRQRSKTKDALLDYVGSQEYITQLILWEKKQATAAQLKKIKNIKQTLFKISPKIFKFLDSIAPNNTKQMLLILKETKQIDAAELIFYMFHRRVSDLIVANNLGNQGLNGMQPWQKQRLVSQAKRFDLQQLLNLHKKLYKIELDTKTGRSPLELSSMLDLIVAEI